MRKVIFVMGLVAALAGCNGTCQQGAADSQTATTTAQTAAEQAPVELIGKRAVLKYPALTAEVQYLSAAEIHWKTTDDKGQVAEQTNALTLERISNTQFFINWVEDDGTTVSQVVDTERGTVKAFLTYEDNGKRVSQLLEGSFTIDN